MSNEVSPEVKARLETAMKEFQEKTLEISKKHGVVIYPGLKYAAEGVIPVWNVSDNPESKDEVVSEP
jgi:hypothetical protein